jgi:hypothetical protein
MVYKENKILNNMTMHLTQINTKKVHAYALNSGKNGKR